MARLGYVEEFIREVHDGVTLGPPSEPFGPLFSRKGQGTIALDPESGAAYRRVVTRLEEQFSPKKDISRLTLQAYVQDALFASLLPDVSPEVNTEFESRLASAIRELGRSLSKPPRNYACYTPVRGLAVEGLPFRVGAVTLVRMNSNRLRRHVSPILAASKGTRAQNRALRADIESDLLGLPMALVNTSARDSDAAENLALNETRLAVDVLNFFSDQIPNSPAWVYLAGEAGAEGSTSLIVCENDSFSVPGRWKGPLAEMSLKRLRSVPQLRRALKRIDALLLQDPRTRMAELLLTSVRWAGRASVEPVKEHAFVMYVIALEALMLPHDARGMAHRLQTRVSHLLGANAEERGWFHDTVKHLYDVRSGIVHEGSVEVEDGDLGRLEMIVKECILRVLSHRTAYLLSTPKEFSRWLDTHR